VFVLKFALGLLSAVLLSSPAAASLVRVEVTGSAFGLVGYLDSVDTSVPGGGSLGPGFFDFEDLPSEVVLSVVGSDLVETVASTTGSFLYSPADESFSECSGLLSRVCFFNGSDVFFGGVVPGDPGVPVFDAMLDTFSMTVQFNCCAVFVMTPASFVYGDDRTAEFTFGNIQYSMAFPAVSGTFDSMSVTVVPGPAALPLLFSALGAFAFLRRRVG
jgi:hypothetical protein